MLLLLLLLSRCGKRAEQRRLLVRIYVILFFFLSFFLRVGTIPPMEIWIRGYVCLLAALLLATPRTKTNTRKYKKKKEIGRITDVVRVLGLTTTRRDCSRLLLARPKKCQLTFSVGRTKERESRM